MPLRDCLVVSSVSLISAWDLGPGGPSRWSSASQLVAEGARRSRAGPGTASSSRILSSTTLARVASRWSFGSATRPLLAGDRDPPVGRLRQREPDERGPVRAPRSESPAVRFAPRGPWAQLELRGRDRLRHQHCAHAGQQPAVQGWCACRFHEGCSRWLFDSECFASLPGSRTIRSAWGTKLGSAGSCQFARCSRPRSKTG